MSCPLKFMQIAGAAAETGLVTLREKYTLYLLQDHTVRFGVL